jgi:hypothetical protein
LHSLLSEQPGTICGSQFHTDSASASTSAMPGQPSARLVPWRGLRRCSLVLLRHAKSAWPDDVPDQDRPVAAAVSAQTWNDLALSRRRRSSSCTASLPVSMRLTLESDQPRRSGNSRCNSRRALRSGGLSGWSIGRLARRYSTGGARLHARSPIRAGRRPRQPGRKQGREDVITVIPLLIPAQAESAQLPSGFEEPTIRLSYGSTGSTRSTKSGIPAVVNRMREAYPQPMRADQGALTV